MIQTPLVKYDLNNKSFTGKTSVNNANFKTPQAKIQLGQVFSTKNSINFTGETINTSRLDKALQYIKNVREHKNGSSYTKKPQELLFPEMYNDIRLSDLDPRQMEGILDGIDVFKGMSVYDLYLLNKMDFLLFQRGCENQCSHCIFESKAPGATMKLENIEKFADGLAELKKRLGFNPIHQPWEVFAPYLDSEPMAVQAKDKNDNTYNLANVLELYYDKTKESFSIITAGWDIEQKNYQKAASDLVDLVKRKPEALKGGIDISFHPFHKWMTKSIKSHDPELKEYYRQKYVDRMTNVIITFLPLFNKLGEDKVLIKLKYMPNRSNHPTDLSISKETTEKMLLEVIDNVIKTCKERNMPEKEYMFLKTDLDKYSRIEPIVSKGRAKRLFNADKELKTTNRIDTSNNELKLLIDDFVDFDEVLRTLLNKQNYFVIDQYVFNINLDKRDDLIENRYNMSMFLRNLIDIKKLFLEHKMIINIQSSDTQKQSEFLNDFKKSLTQYNNSEGSDTVDSIINSIKVNSVDLSKFDKEIKHLTDLYNLIPDDNQNKKEFTRAIGLLSTGQTKALNTDGSVLILQREEEGDVNKNTYTIKGLKFNFENDDEQIKKQTPLQELDFDTKSYIVSQIPRTVIERDKKYNLTGDDQNIRTISFGRKLERWA